MLPFSFLLRLFFLGEVFWSEFLFYSIVCPPIVCSSAVSPFEFFIENGRFLQSGKTGFLSLTIIFLLAAFVIACCFFISFSLVESASPLVNLSVAFAASVLS